MFLRFHARIKDGKDHRYWSVVENRRCGRGKVVQRQVLYLGEINDSQRESWCRTIEIFDEKIEQTMPLALFPADRQLPNFAAGFGVRHQLQQPGLDGPAVHRADDMQDLGRRHTRDGSGSQAGRTLIQRSVLK